MVFRVLRVVSCCFAPPFVPVATSTANGSSACARRRATLTSVSPAARRAVRLSSSSLKAEPAVAELGAHPVLVVRAQIEDQHPAARLEHARRFGQRARPDPCA